MISLTGKQWLLGNKLYNIRLRIKEAEAINEVH